MTPSYHRVEDWQEELARGWQPAPGSCTLAVEHREAPGISEVDLAKKSGSYGFEKRQKELEKKKKKQAKAEKKARRAAQREQAPEHADLEVGHDESAEHGDTD